MFALTLLHYQTFELHLHNFPSLQTPYLLRIEYLFHLFVNNVLFIILIARVEQWWAKSNSESIQSCLESQRIFDSNIARFDSSTMRFDTGSIQILTIRFRWHAIWTEISKSWLKLNTHSHYSLLSQILSSNVWFYPSLMYARNNNIRSLLLSGFGFERRDQCT